MADPITKLAEREDAFEASTDSKIDPVVGGHEGETAEKDVRSPEEQEFILRVYDDFQVAYNEKVRGDFRELGGRTLSQFWRDGRDEYNALLPPKEGWHKRAKRTIVRDKANAFISNLTKNVIKGEIIAQNADQMIDVLASRILRGGVDHVEKVDKWSRKFISVVHTTTVDGTCHVREDYVNGRITRVKVPNEFIFIKDSYQPDIQLQEVIFEVEEMSYHKAKLQFGSRPNFSKVLKGNKSGWVMGDAITQRWSGDVAEDNVLVVRVQYHDGYRPDGRPKRKIWNVIINDVLMFPVDQRSPYKHGRFNYAKSIFESFADSDFYWGNSLGNKLRNDAMLADAFYSLVINKAYLSLLPPLINRTGQTIDDQIIAPGNTVPTQYDVRDSITKIPGVGEPLNVSDTEVLRLIEAQSDRGSVSPQASGGDSIIRQTASEAIIKQENIKLLMGLFGRMIGHVIEDLTEMTISNFLQFCTKQNMDKVVNGSDVFFKADYTFTGQTLHDGRTGELNVSFMEDLPELESLKRDMSIEIYKAEKASKVPRNVMFADPVYMEDLSTLVQVVANPVEEMSQIQREAFAMERYKSLYLNNPNINQEAATRRVIRAVGDEEDELMQAQPMPQMGGGPPGAAPPSLEGPTPGVGPITKQVNSPNRQFGRLSTMVPIKNAQ